MYTLYSLPPELQLKIVKEMTTEGLFKIVIDASPNDNGIFRYILDQSRIELFKRRGEEAEKYQYTLLGSWIKHWNKYQKLSFIKNGENKNEWILILEAAIKDGTTSLNHKTKCSLLINKLICGRNDVCANELQSIIDDMDNSHVEKRLEISASEFFDTHLEIIAKCLLGLIDREMFAQGAAVRSAIKSLEIIAIYVSPTIRNLIIERILRLNPTNIYAHMQHFETISKLLPFADHKQKDLFCSKLITIAQHKVSDLRVSAIEAMAKLAPYANVTQREQMIETLTTHATLDQEILANIHMRSTQQSALLALKLLAPYAKNRDPIILNVMEHFKYRSTLTWNDAAEMLAGVAEILDESTKEKLVKFLISKHSPYNDDFNALEPLLTFTTNQQRHDIKEVISSSLNHSELNVRCQTIQNLDSLYRYSKKPEYKEIINLLIDKLSDVSIGVRGDTVRILAPLISDANANQRAAMLNPILNIITDANYVFSSAQKALIMLAPKLTLAERERISDILISRINCSSNDYKCGIINALVSVSTDFSAEKCQEIATLLLRQSMKSDDVHACLSGTYIHALGAFITYTTPEQRKVIYTLLRNNMQGHRYCREEAHTLVLASVMSYFSNDDLSSLLSLQCVGSDVVSIKLIAQTQININNYRQAKLENHIEGDFTLVVRKLFSNT